MGFPVGDSQGLRTVSQPLGALPGPRGHGGPGQPGSWTHSIENWVQLKMGWLVSGPDAHLVSSFQNL